MLLRRLIMEREKKRNELIYKIIIERDISLIYLFLYDTVNRIRISFLRFSKISTCLFMFLITLGTNSKK